MRWDVVVRREVEPLIDALRGKRAGYGDAIRQLELDPCVEFPTADGGTRPFAYRLTRDTRDRRTDTWQIVHDLFGEANPPEDHLRPPCCRNGLPTIDDAELDEFLSRLRRFLR